MLELIIKKEKDKKRIALVNNEILEEYYEENEDSNKNEGNIYIGVVKNIIKGMGSAFIDIGTEKNGFIHLKDVLPKIDETKQKQDENILIENILKPGQKILVQVKKDSNEKKGARISTHINLPGIYIALMPNTDIITVSQKIEDVKEQERLKKLVRENLTEGNGAIIRTSAKNKTEEIIEDIKRLEKKWNKIINISIDPKQSQPKLLYKSEGIIERIVMDLSKRGLEQILVNDEKEYKKLCKMKEETDIYDNIKIIKKDSKDILKNYTINKQIEKLQNRKIWLRCGGFITIDKTEALTAIDVNTGKYIGKNEVEETIYTVNKEATIEIAKQLRLRDIGGIIIIDYIDMKEEKSKEKIQKILEEELKKDRSKTQVEGFTKLDLLEMTRKHICSHID